MVTVVDLQSTDAWSYVRTVVQPTVRLDQALFSTKPIGPHGDHISRLEQRLQPMETRAASSAGVGTSVSEDESRIIRANERMVGLHYVTLAEFDIRF